MPVLPAELQSVFEEIEQKAAPLADHDVSAVINTVVKQRKDAGEVITPEIQAEAMAFDFRQDYLDDQTGWGTYYGPLIVMPREGGYVERPSIRAITGTMLDYWEQRAAEAKHPVLKARYADLVWDLSQKGTRSQLCRQN